MKKLLAALLAFVLCTGLFGSYTALAAIETYSFTIKNTGTEFTRMDTSCLNKKTYAKDKWSLIVDAYSVKSGTRRGDVAFGIMRKTKNSDGDTIYTECGMGWVERYQNYDNCHFGWYSGGNKTGYYYCPAGRTDSSHSYTMSVAGRFNADKVTFPVL
jgi:hypothetical protein